MATKERIFAQEVAKAVGAGKAVALETVDFSDPNRPKTCLGGGFPDPARQPDRRHRGQRRQADLPDVEVVGAAAVERIPLDADRGRHQGPGRSAQAAKLVWDNYYANHQKKGAFKHLKVADIFMGGGTTLVEGSRLGMQMSGNDLNPVAWFVVKQELANVDLEEVKRLLADIEAEVKPQIMPYLLLRWPARRKGTMDASANGRGDGGRLRSARADPGGRAQGLPLRRPGDHLHLLGQARPVPGTGCGHRTPIMTSPVMAVKTLTVKHWEHTCAKCGAEFHVEEDAARMAPDAPLYVAPDEHPFSVLDRKGAWSARIADCDTALIKLERARTRRSN